MSLIINLTFTPDSRVPQRAVHLLWLHHRKLRRLQGGWKGEFFLILNCPCDRLRQLVTPTWWPQACQSAMSLIPVRSAGWPSRWWRPSRRSRSDTGLTSSYSWGWEFTLVRGGTNCRAVISIVMQGRAVLALWEWRWAECRHVSTVTFVWDASLLLVWRHCQHR